MSEMIIEDLMCGHTIIVYDEPERVTSPYGNISVPMRITHSPIRFMVRLKGGSAFRGSLSAINVKPGEARNKAIEKDLLEWLMKHIGIIETRYRQGVKEVCDGSCQSKVCFSKPPPD